MHSPIAQQEGTTYSAAPNGLSIRSPTVDARTFWHRALIVIIIDAIVTRRSGWRYGAKKVVFMLLAGGIMVGIKPHWLDAAEAGAEWQRIIAAAKKEGKVVIGAPPGNDFRNEVQAVLKNASISTAN